MPNQMIIPPRSMVVKIGVVGAGIMGLSTAVRTQQELPQAQVTVIADKFGSETTSWGAGGLFRPTSKHTQGARPGLIKQWSSDSAKHYMKIAGSVDAGRYGVFPMSGCHFTNAKEDPEYKEFLYSVREMTKDELKKKGSQYPYGYAITTFIIEPTLYMPQLMKQFEANGGLLEKRSLQSLEELVGRFDVVVNCSGLASRWLVNDPLIIPIRGQIMKVHAPWIKTFYFDDNDAYVIPRSEDVVLGGVRQKGDYSTEIRDADRRHILDKVTQVVPSVQRAAIVKEWAGLRPHRSPVRLETEHMAFKSGTLPVVHNYGHGSNGIALSWGTAVHATDLVKECVRNITPRSQL